MLLFSYRYITYAVPPFLGLCSPAKIDGSGAYAPFAVSSKLVMLLKLRPSEMS